ncbi:uncharacterized protein LOC132031972 [Lycium ferocissimum]|uniref:uncharacterized protein LOC132031972 n=1 Tax=Lycium ferocissimum TaxID=112874 RepID=UPI0028164372|nr:uncharacterized protein LOC132031972 [Lycium ferocissimum]
MWQLHNKMKAVTKKLSCWSSETYGDIFRNAKEAEKEVKALEKRQNEDNNDENMTALNKAKAEFIRLLKNQDEIYRERDKAKWLKDGEKNTSYFHKVIKDRRRRLSIHNIQDSEGQNIMGHDDIAKAAIKHFEDLFTYQEIKGSFNILDQLPKLVTEDMNCMLTDKPSTLEIRNAIKSIDPESAPGLMDLVPNSTRFVLTQSYQIFKRPFMNSLMVHQSQGKPSDIRKVMRILTVYENVSGQQVNKSKSCVAMAPKTSLEVIHRTCHLTRMHRKEWPIKYFGCPLFVGRMKIIYFSEMVHNITRRIHTWHARFLSKGGKIVLVKHILLAMPVHLLATMKPPKGTFEQLEGAINSFIWNDNDTKRKYHWRKWESMCLPNEEGGVGFRCLRDVSEAFIAKQWWNLRTKESMWKEYMLAKYCSRVNLIIRKSVGVQSQTWRALGKLLPADYSPNNIRLNEAYEDGIWQWDRAGYRVPKTIRWEVQHISIHFNENKEDKAIWASNPEGRFTVSSAWNLLRKKANGDWHDRRTWHTSCSLKVNFHMWRIIKNRIATANNIGSHIYRITGKDSLLIKEEIDWLSFCNKLNTNPIRKSIRIVKWIPPPPSFIKLNSDGSCRGELCGGGGVIRNDKGKLIQAYSMNLGKGTSNCAEAKALQHGTEWCISEGWRKIIVESDSLLVVQAIQGKVADKLAQVGHSHNDIVTYKEFQELPTSVRGILNIDRMGLPNIRTRPISNSNYYFDPP